MRLALNAALFYVSWFVCVVGMGSRIALLAPLAAVLTVAIHLASQAEWRAEAAAVMVAALIGPLLESVLAWIGVVRFSETMLMGLYAPVGVVSMWAVFATTFDVSLAWLSARIWLAAALAAIGAPLSYAAAARLEAVELLDGWPIAVAGVWAVGFPLVLFASAAVRRRVQALGSFASDDRETP